MLYHGVPGQLTPPFLIHFTNACQFHFRTGFCRYVRPRLLHRIRPHSPAGQGTRVLPLFQRVDERVGITVAAPYATHTISLYKAKESGYRPSLTPLSTLPVLLQNPFHSLSYSSIAPY